MLTKISGLHRRSTVARLVEFSGRISSTFDRSFSSTTGTDITPEEAGRIAHKLSNDGEKSGTNLAGIGTLLSHAGVQTSQTNAPLSPPLHLATTYTRPADGPYHDGDSIYARADNPTRLLLEETVGTLECHGATEAINAEPITCAFSSGMAAISSIFLAHKSPITVLLPQDVYHGVPTVLTDIMCRHGIQSRRVDFTNLSTIQSAISDIQDDSDIIVWMENPSNPKCEVIDIAAVCSLIRTECSDTSTDNRITTVVDSTMAPPCISQPLLMGADFVVHSGTKFLGGHSDVLLGIVTASPWTDHGQELGPILKQVQISMGAVASAFDSWLTMRGLRTLHVRVAQQCRTALSVAEFLHNHPRVSKVHYPGLKSHPQHNLAKQQFTDGCGGGVLSIEFETEAMAMAVAGALRTIIRATSLGGTETLIEHRASIEPPTRRTSPPGLLRLSCGLEDASDLIVDLDRAISIADTIGCSLTGQSMSSS
mmetsp:Transcript_26012/g.36680  ORF Transcript_26012/g.36680 Transcript_26012/m.36680 type:complete len:481 (+) Transcript_26012:58-1500(+)